MDGKEGGVKGKVGGETGRERGKGKGRAAWNRVGRIRGFAPSDRPSGSALQEMQTVVGNRRVECIR